jgi:hypothetical protein
MNMSELYEKVRSSGDIFSYALYLAAPDSDGSDVDLANVVVSSFMLKPVKRDSIRRPQR